MNSSHFLNQYPVPCTVIICPGCAGSASTFCKNTLREYVRRSDRGNQGLRKYLDDYGTDYTADDFIEGNLKDYH